MHTSSLPVTRAARPTRRWRAGAVLGAGALLAGALTAPVDAAPAERRVASTVHLELPAGFQPEGIAIEESGRFAYLGSRLDGDLARLDLDSGAIQVISQGPGTPSVGVKVDDRDRVFVSGGSGGDARVVNARNGKLKRSYDLVPDGTTAFINDVVLTEDAAYFTDSASAQLFALPFRSNGRLPKQSGVRRIPLGGAWVQGTGNNANGLTETPDGKALLVVNSSSGLLYRVDKETGAATVVDLGGTLLTNGDGLLLEGTTLFAVQNRLNQVAALKIARDGRSGRLKRTITNTDFDVPTTIARSGDRLYAPNARFTTPATPTTPYWVTGFGVEVPRSAVKAAEKADKAEKAEKERRS